MVAAMATVMAAVRHLGAGHTVSLYHLYSPVANEVLSLNIILYWNTDAILLFGGIEMGSSERCKSFGSGLD
jgi:hypothetical protein